MAVIDDLSAGRKENLSPNTPLTVKLINEIDKSDIEDFDIIIHCAVRTSTFLSVDYPEEDFQRNAQSTFHLLETLRKHNDNTLIIYISSRSVHGNIPEPEIADENYPTTQTHSTTPTKSTERCSAKPTANSTT